MERLLPAAFEGIHARLRPVSRKDHPAIFAQRISPTHLDFDLAALSIPDFDRWEGKELPEMLQGGPTMVAEGLDGEYLGLVRAYRIETRDRRGFLEWKLFDYDSHAALEVSIAMLDYLFSYLNLRKVYVESMESNHTVLEWAAKLGFQEEVRLTDYFYRQGSYHDLVYCGQEAQEWSGVREKIANSLLFSTILSGETEGQTERD